jgi:anti-sigma factor RsiW
VSTDKEQRDSLLCRDVVGDIVALHRGELPPLRAESMHEHLARCVECRETSLEFQLAEKTIAALPDVTPPVDLISVTLKRLASARRGSPAMPAPQGEPRHLGFLFRPIRSRVARLGIALAFVLIAVAVNVPSVAESIGRAQTKIIGTQTAEKLDDYTQSILMRLFL